MLEKLSWFSLSLPIYLFYYLSFSLSLDFAAIPSRHPEVLYAWTLCQTVGKRYGPLPVIALLGCIHFCAPFVHRGCNAALFRKWKKRVWNGVRRFCCDDQLDVAVELFRFSLYHFDRCELSVNNRICYARVQGTNCVIFDTCLKFFFFFLRLRFHGCFSRIHFEIASLKGLLLFKFLFHRFYYIIPVAKINLHDWSGSWIC